MKEKMKRVVLLLLVLVIGAVGWHFWQQGSTGQTGKVEQEVVPHYSEVSGKIAELKVQLGQTVQAGDVLAVIDNSNQQYAVEQLEQVLVQKQAVVAQLLSGADQAAVQQDNAGGADSPEQYGSRRQSGKYRAATGDFVVQTGRPQCGESGTGSSGSNRKPVGSGQRSTK